MTSETPALHVVFGAGQVGRQLAAVLLARGLRVRLVRRGAPGAAAPGLSWARGDATDHRFAAEVCRGAEVVYHCANPAEYHLWPALLPPLATSIREAAARAGARLVVLDNVYLYGRPEGRPLTEDSPVRPCSVKGELRARLAAELFEAHARGDLRVTSGRAADYFGPGTTRAAVFHERFVRRVERGQAIEVLGDPDALHSYAYTPDVARALAELGASEAAWGRAWHLPVAHQGSTRELAARFAEAAGQPLRLRRVPRWLIRSLGVVAPTLRAVPEILYQFEDDFVVDDRRFRATFGEVATGVEAAVRDTLRAADEPARRADDGPAAGALSVRA